jgi:hypothetical protein
MIAVVPLLVLLLAAGCSLTGSDEPQPDAPPSPGATVEPTDPSLAALQMSPYPYLLPLPEPTQTVLDGTYTKVEQREDRAPCRRCPNYPPEGGVWRLSLDRGVFHIYHEITGWHSVGSFVVTRDHSAKDAPDQLVLFNDLSCPDAIGLYRWKLEDSALILEATHDTCAIHLRAMSLTNLPWLSCQPSNSEAGISDHWPKPPGCD